MPERINNFDRQHINRLLLQEKQINALFNQLIRLVAPEMRKWHDADNKNSVTEIAKKFSVSRTMLYRIVNDSKKT